MPSRLVSIESKIGNYLPTIAVRSGPTATIFKLFEGVGKEEPTAAPGLLCLGDSFPNNPVGEASNPFPLWTVTPREQSSLLRWVLRSLGRAHPCLEGPVAAASHHAGLDVLVGDLLVVVGAAAG